MISIKGLLQTEKIMSLVRSTLTPSNKIQVSVDSYWLTNFSSINCNESKWHFCPVSEIDEIIQQVSLIDKSRLNESKRNIFVAYL